MRDPAAPPGLNLTFRLFLLVAGALSLLRVAGLMLSPLGLHPDEAQYWVWSRTLDWGYFSKPPLVAWTIAATTGLFGNDPWAVRLAAPFLHFGAALALFALGRRLYGEAAGWWAGVSWLLIPGVWLSSALITTDALLLPIWSGALLASWRWIETRAIGWALLVGALIGLGALAKYAMGFFPAGLAMLALWSPSARKALLSPQALAGAAAALLVVAPNVWWNFTHDFETLQHTAANANLGGDLFNVDQLGAFIGDQFAIAGVLAVGLLLLVVGYARGREPIDERAKFLFAFIAPALLFMIAQALISRAHGNWAAVAYPAAIVLVTGKLAGTRLVRWGAVAHATMFAIFMGLALFPDAAYRAPLIGRGIENGLKRMNAWDETADVVAGLARSAADAGAPFSAVLVDHRHMYCELAYHWRDTRDLPPLRMYVLRGAPGNQAEAAAPMTANLGARVLVVHMSPRYEKYVASDFAQFRRFAEFTVPLGPRKTRALAFSEASGFQPVPRTKAFLDEVGE